MKKKKITFINNRVEWAERVSQPLSLLIYGFLVALTSKQQANLEHRKKRNEIIPAADEFWRVLNIGNTEIGEFLVSNGKGSTNIRRAIRRSMESLQQAEMIAFYANPYLKNRHGARKIEVLWDDQIRSFVTPYKREISDKYQLSSGHSSGHLADHNGPVELNPSGPFLDSSGPLADHFSLLADHNGPVDNSIQVDKQGQNADFESHKNIRIIDNIETGDTVTASLEATQSIPENKVPPRTRNETQKVPVPHLSFWDTPGVKGDDQLIALTTTFIEDVKAKHGFDPAPFFEADMYRKIVASELNPYIQLEYGPITDFAAQSFGWKEDKYAWDFLTKDYWGGDKQEAFKAVMRNYPRGFGWKNDSGVPWSSPDRPFIMYADKNEYKKILKSNHKNPFKKDVTFATMDLVMQFHKSYPSPTGGKIPMHWMNPEFSRRMQWLCGTTGLYFGAIDELYKEFKATVLNPSTMFGQIYKRESEKEGGSRTDIMSWFKDFALARQLENRGIYYMRNTENHWILKHPGSIVTETFELGGSVVYHVDESGKRQEVYMTPYQFEVWENNLYANQALLDKMADSEV